MFIALSDLIKIVDLWLNVQHCWKLICPYHLGEYFLTHPNLITIHFADFRLKCTSTELAGYIQLIYQVMLYIITQDGTRINTSVVTYSWFFYNLSLRLPWLRNIAAWLFTIIHDDHLWWTHDDTDTCYVTGNRWWRSHSWWMVAALPVPSVPHSIFVIWIFGKVLKMKEMTHYVPRK